MGRSSGNPGDNSYYNNVTPPYDAIVYRWGAGYYAEDRQGNQIISPRSEAGIVIKTASFHVNSVYGGGVVYIAEDTYTVSTQILQYSNTVFRGAGINKTVLQSSGMAVTLLANADSTNGNTYIGCENMTIDHNAGTDGSCINYSKVSNSHLRRCYLKGNSASFTLYWTGVNAAITQNYVQDNIFEGDASASFDTFGGGYFEDSVVSGNIIKSGLGSAGIAHRLGVGNVWANNTIYDQGASGLVMETGSFNALVGNTIHDCATSGIRCIDSVDGASHDNLISSNVCYSNDKRGIEIDGTRNVIIGNHCYQNGLAGIEVYETNTVIGNVCMNNGQDTSGSATHRSGIRLTDATYCTVIGNQCQDTQGSPTQLRGINEVTSADHNVIEGNVTVGNSTAQIVLTGSNTICRNNKGFVTENKGTGTIANGATSSGNIAHGLSYTPAASEFTINFTENPTNTAGTIWIDGIDGTNFVVNCENDPGASGLDFGWSVRKV